MSFSNARFVLGFVGAMLLFGVVLTVFGKPSGSMDPVHVRFNGPRVFPDAAVAHPPRVPPSTYVRGSTP